MNVRMPDGSYVHMPDEWTTDQKYFFLKGKLQPPSIGERVKGALGAGVASTIETAANIRELIPGHAAAAEDMRRAASELRGADYIRRIEMAQPESTLGKVGQGLVEFMPQMPLYMGGEAAALGAAKTIPALRGAVTALEAVPGASALKEIPKSAARAAVGGMTVGALGAPPGSGVVGSIKHGAEEAVAFAGAVTAFGTLFRLLGASGRALLRINRSAIEGLKPEQQAELVDKVSRASKEDRAAVLEEELKSAKAYSPWENLYRDEYERQAEAESPWAALAQQRDELRNLSRNSEVAADALKKTEEVVDWAKRQEEIGSRNQATIRRMREKIRVQQEENAKILPQEVKPNDQTDLTGMGSAERVGEEARRSVQDASLGEEAPRTGGDVQAYEGKEGLSLLEQYKLAKEAEGFDDFDWFERQGLGERWELHKRGYGIEEVLKMSEEDALKKLLTRPEPAMPSPDDLLSWQNRQAGMVASQVARRKAGATVKAENRPEDYAARKKLKERVAKLEAERKADLAMIDDIIKADKASPRSIDDAVAATVRIISKENNPELFAQIAQAYTPQAIERMQNKSEFESWRRKGEAKGRPYNLTMPGREQVVQKEGESLEYLAAQEQGARFEGEEEMDIHRRRGVTLSFLGTGELDKWFGDFRDSVRTKMETSPLLKKPLRDVRTLKNIRDFIEPNKYDVPPAAAKLVEDISGEEAKLYDMTEKRGADIMKASEWLVPTVRLFEKHPGAARAATEIIMADQTVGYNQGIHFSVLRDAVAGLTQKERGMLKAVIEEKKSAPEHVVAAARKLTEWLTLMKGRYQTYLDEMFKAHLMPEQYEAVRKVANGADLDTTAKAAKMKPKLLKSLVDKWNSVEKWGLDPETYVPHVERGAIKLMVKTDKGKFKTVAVALSKDHAVEKARELIASGQKELYMDTTIPESLKDLPEPMRPMQYFRVATKLRKAIAEDLVDLNKELKAKQVLRGVMEVRPTKKFTPFEKPRHDVLAGEEDIVPVLYAYAHSMEAKMQMDPVIDKVQDLVPHLPANMRNAMINLVDEVKGKHWTSDQIAEEIFRSVGWETKPRPFSRFVSHVKMAEALFKFAYRPVALAVNAASAAGHIWTKTGTKYLTEGFRFMRTEEGKRLLDSVRHLLGTDQVTEMSGKTHGKLHLWHPLGMFQMPEKPMRELALCANYLLARDKGLIGSEAIEFAVRANWMQNFIYNTAALPKALRSPMGRLLGQFKPYLIQEVNFISQLRGAEAVRYLAVMATLGGPIGYMATLKTLPVLSMFPWWGEVEDYINTNIPRLSRGVPGLLGVDISAPATFQFPTKWEDWAGPFVSDLLKIKREVLDPVTRGEILDAPEAMRKVAGETIPIMRHWNEFIDQVIDKDGWVKDERGRNIYHIGESPLDMAKYAFKLAAGAKDLERSVIQKHESFLKEQERVRTRNKQTVVDEILDAVEHGEPVTAKMLNAMTEFNINTASLRRAAKFRQLDAQTRRYILTEVAKRPEVLEGWPQLE